MLLYEPFTLKTYKEFCNILWLCYFYSFPLKRTVIAVDAITFDILYNTNKCKMLQTYIDVQKDAITFVYVLRNC